MSRCGGIEMSDYAKSSEVEAVYETEEGAKGVIYKRLFRKAEGRKMTVNLQILQPRGTTKMHSHNGQHAHYVISGKGALIYGDDAKRISINAGDATYLYDGEKHFFENDGNEELILLAIRSYA
jgi:quercetin dioxygenase-like cupin family protein